MCYVLFIKKNNIKKNKKMDSKITQILNGAKSTSTSNNNNNNINSSTTLNTSSSSSSSSSNNSFEVVVQHLHCDLPFVSGKQELCLRHCVSKVFISSFYGDFSIYDQSGRLLGKSKESKLSLFKTDLQTEACKVWYDSSSLVGEHDVLRNQYKVKDPGMYFNFGNVFIEFENAPEPRTDKVYPHIPIFYNITNVWFNQEKRVLFKI
jgi:hypothetical protein